MKRSKFYRKEPFCGFPYGFHEFASLPEMPEDDCCIHCGQPRHEIESLNPPIKANKPNPNIEEKVIGEHFEVYLSHDDMGQEGWSQAEMDFHYEVFKTDWFAAMACTSRNTEI